MAITPMMRQYLQTKEENPDCILFFRLGDFYEMFFEDAKLVSGELDLTLTGKDCGLEERAPMCGVPYHAADTYIRRLIEKGYRVAICDQMSDPSESKGLVERAVTRIVTPGTVIAPEMLDERAPSYIMSLYFSKDRAGAAFCDVSTGDFYIYEIDRVKARLADEIARIAPRELLVNDRERLSAVTLSAMPAIGRTDADAYDIKRAAALLTEHFGGDLAALGLRDDKLCVCAAGALLAYLIDTQKNALTHIISIKRFDAQRVMMIDRVAANNLELLTSGRDRTRRGSLLHTIDRTVTSMGARMLRDWIERPLLDRAAIEARLSAVTAFKSALFAMEEMRDRLKGVSDIERLLSKIAFDTVNARECLALKASLFALPAVKQCLSQVDDPLIASLNGEIDPMESLGRLLANAISEDAPLSIREGGIIRTGYNEQLDQIRVAASSGKTWIVDYEKHEREATGIKNLKVGFNRVFGYYIEVTKSAYNLVPIRYMRKQTLVNCERYITEELKNIEKQVLGADDQAVRLEYSLFSEIRAQLKAALPSLQRLAQALKTIDALQSLARIASESDYVRPQINEDGVIEIIDGRHPVVETSIGRDAFVPNDTALSPEKRVMIITGPNMAGKSTYMRQVALIVLLAHIGSYVPARSANIPLTDRIFTRIGASDDLYGGQSTFMVEMNELATILQYATKRSLVLLDEVGRGTSTFDGLSIAWATVEHIAQKTGCLTLFATHYHELSELEGQLEGVVDYRITAREQGDSVIFLRKIVPGGADRSFGIAVASLAGLPSTLISRARRIMARLEVDGEMSGSIGKTILDKRKNAGTRQVGIQEFGAMELVEELKAIDVMSLSPIDALNKLYTIQEKARRV